MQSELKISDLRFNRSSYTLHSRHLKHLINLISSNNSLNRKISLAVSTCQFDCRDCEPLPSLKTDIELDGKELDDTGEGSVCVPEDLSMTLSQDPMLSAL